MSEKLLDQLMSFAEKEDNIRFMALNGSRVDPKVRPDRFMDFDVVYGVKDPEPFLEDPAWCRVFGRSVISQTPFFMEGDEEEELIFMTWYKDGSRSDIRILPLERLEDYLKEDSLTEVLLDKDGRIPSLPEPCDRSHWLTKPSEKRFQDRVNEFWWVSLYVTKALARGQHMAAVQFLNMIREELVRVMAWNRAHEEDYRLDFGGYWKFLEALLPDKKCRELKKTMDLQGLEEVAGSLALCRRLFDRECREYAEKTGYSFPDYRSGVLVLEKDWLEESSCS